MSDIENMIKEMVEELGEEGTVDCCIRTILAVYESQGFFDDGCGEVKADIGEVYTFTVEKHKNEDESPYCHEYDASEGDEDDNDSD